MQHCCMLYDNSVKTVLHLYDCSPTCKHVRICCTLASSPLLQAPRKASPTPSLPTILLVFYQNPGKSGWLEFHRLRFHIEDMEADTSDNLFFLTLTNSKTSEINVAHFWMLSSAECWTQKFQTWKVGKTWFLVCRDVSSGAGKATFSKEREEIWGFSGEF